MSSCFGYRKGPAGKTHPMRRGLIIPLIYVVVGVVVASAHHYFAHAAALKPIVSAVLAVLLWPLLLLGISLHVR